MIEEFYEELQEVKTHLDSVKLELEAERHTHKKDNEYLLARAERAEQRVRELATIFGVSDGGRYINDAYSRAEALGLR